MALKIRTVMTYPLTGAVDFAITFEYLARKFVTVTLIGKDRKELVLNQDYRFTTKTQITTTRAWTAADGYDSIEIRRYTSATDRLVDFADGSILRAYDLNIAQIQTLHVAEEARDLTADTIGVNNDGHLDARGRRIVNVANPVDDGDAVNLRSLKVWNDSALNSANRAKESAEEAKRQSDWAGRMRNEAEQFKNEAGQHRNVAESAKDKSITAKGQSEAARDLAAGSRNESLRFAEESNSYMGWSKKWAVNPVGVVVQDGEYSARHWQYYCKFEADKAKSEADRAKAEADKLGNMTALAESIETVQDGSVFWKNHVRTKSGNVFAERWSDADPGLNEYYSSNALVATYRIGGIERLTTTLYAEGNWGQGATERATISILRRNAGNELTGGAYFHFYPTGSFYSKSHSAMGWQSGWGEVANDPSRAPFQVTDVINNNGSFVPAVTCYSSSTGGYPVRFTNGIISNGTDRWADVVLARMEGDNGYAATYQCQMGGGLNAWISAPGQDVRWIWFPHEAQSDARLKTIHGQLDTKRPLVNIEAMNFVEFTFNSDKKGAIRRGVIAQELQKIDPEYVHNRVYDMGGGETKEILQLDMTPMTLDALAAIQELSAQVKELKAELKQLKEAK